MENTNRRMPYILKNNRTRIFQQNSLVYIQFWTEIFSPPDLEQNGMKIFIPNV